MTLYSYCCHMFLGTEANKTNCCYLVQGAKVSRSIVFHLAQALYKVHSLAQICCHDVQGAKVTTAFVVMMQ
jgi:hypothetical protein